MTEPQQTTEGSTFERQLAENCVEYFLFSLGDETDARNQLARLETIRKAALQLCQTIAKDYIWQRDEFNLELKTEKGLTYLHGVTDYGDAVEDEWLIVYLLRQLSQSHPRLWVRIADEDGEFLLIEAANVVPKWLSPEIDRNRAWIHDGKLLIIPCDKAQSESPDRNLSLTGAVQHLKSQPDNLVHSTFVEAEAFYRLEKYPGHVNESMHHALVTIPRNLAFILHTLPKSVAPAVEAFYLREPVALKPILSSSKPLVFPPDDLVTVSVRFSRVLFAQLRSQQFDAPPRWRDALQKARTAGAEANDQEVLRLETGMKLTCGFEMLAANADKHKSRVVREVAIMLDDMREDGEEALPTNEEISSWPTSNRNDDESWMDINYQDFERELEGRHTEPKGDKNGFGDVRTQDDLRKIVSRFEAFLNDDTAGLDGAELEDMDMDDDGDSDDYSDDGDYEDKEVSFDEEEFSRMMREMMGLPAKDTERPPTKGKTPDRMDEEDLDAIEEDKAIQELSAQMESELKKQGALTLDPPANSRQLKGKEPDKGPSQGASRPSDAQDDSEDDEVDIDYNLAKNLLESFKSQGGMAGPTGNLLGLMGFRLPRDEDDEAEEQGDGGPGPSRMSGGSK